MEKVGEAGVVGVRALLWGAGSGEFCFSPAAWLGDRQGGSFSWYFLSPLHG